LGGKLIRKQHLTTNISEASIARFIGYDVRYLPNEKQFAIIDPGDLSDLWKDLRTHKQGVTDALGLIEVVLQMVKESGDTATVTMPSGLATELLPMQHRDSEDRTWITRDTTTAILLHYANYRLIRTEVQNGSVEFIFAWDDKLTEVIKRLNKNEWLVSPKKWSDSAFVIRDIVRRAKGYGAPHDLSKVECHG
jgi:hypothetical protein